MLASLFLSCNENDLVNSDLDVVDDDSIEVADLDYDGINDENNADEPSCLDEWDKTETVEDVSELFDFEIVNSETEGNWETGENYDSLYFDITDASIVADLIVDENDRIFLLGRFNEGETENFLKVINTDGLVENYSFVTEEDPFMYKIWDRQFVAPDMEFNKEAGTVDILGIMNSKTEEFFDSKKKAKPFIIKYGSKEDISYKTWLFESNNVCENIKIIDGQTHLSCWYSFEFRDWSEPAIYHASFQIIDGEKVYRKTIFENKNVLSDSISLIDSDTYHLFVNVPVDMNSEFMIKGPVYSYDKDFCITSETQWSKLGSNILLINYGFNKVGDDIVFYGENERSVFKNNEIKTAHLYPAIFWENENKLVGIGSDNSITFFGDKFIGNLNMYNDIKIEEESFFLISGSTYDSEDKDRVWGGMEDESFTPDYSWYFDPAISHINSDGEVFIRQLVTPENEEMYLKIFVKENFIYVAGVGVSDEEKRKVFIHKIPNNWLINEDAKAKESRFWVEEF